MQQMQIQMLTAQQHKVFMSHQRAETGIKKDIGMGNPLYQTSLRGVPSVGGIAVDGTVSSFNN
jgi:hypothetical protein